MITNTQTQILKQHLQALHEDLLQSETRMHSSRRNHSAVAASLINELGPHLCPTIAECVALSGQTIGDCCPNDIDCICETLGKLDTMLEKALIENTPPGEGFRDLIAKLLEQLGPFLIQALIGFLMRPVPPARIKYTDIN